MNDKIAASILARLLAKGLLVGVWVPPQDIRELRGLVSQRKKMTGLATQAKNRLHAVIQAASSSATGRKSLPRYTEEVVAGTPPGSLGKSECRK